MLRRATYRQLQILIQPRTYAKSAKGHTQMLDCSQMAPFSTLLGVIQAHGSGAQHISSLTSWQRQLVHSCDSDWALMIWLWKLDVGKIAGPTVV